MIRTLASLVLVLGFAWLAAAPAADKPDPTDTKAKELAEQFLKALKGQDVDAVMKLVEAPFFWNGEEYIKDDKGVRAKFAEAVKTNEDLPTLKATFVEVWAAEKLPECVFPKETKEFAKKFASEIDRIV